MKTKLTVLLAFFVGFTICLLVTTGCTADNTYDFTVTSENGVLLGSGKMRLSFKIGADGKGMAEWQFTPTQAASTNRHWLIAKAKLTGKGKAEAACTNSWFTVDFNPGWADNNVVVMWALNKQASGTLFYADFSGGHPCALFRISQAAQPNVPVGSPAKRSTNSPASGEVQTR